MLLVLFKRFFSAVAFMFSSFEAILRVRLQTSIYVQIEADVFQQNFVVMDIVIARMDRTKRIAVFYSIFFLFFGF